jgi:hypothetical protein
MNVLPSPCDSCPYRRDCPLGVWHESEYEKLRDYDHNRAFSLFLCHQTPNIGEETACRGWLTVHSESVAARLAVCQGLVTDEQRYAPVSVPLYRNGEEAADAGEAKIRRPGKAARKMIEKIVRRRG